jgi:hypothetical protein
MSTKFNWTCPHCNRPQTVTDSNFDQFDKILHLSELNLGDIEAVGVRVTAISCLNEECRQLTFVVALHDTEFVNGRGTVLNKELQEWKLLPESTAKPQPEFIPEVLREDYYEACRIRDLSPKASATLARRCLQGMIRDFCGIADGTLDKEIKSLQSLVEADRAPRGVTPESVEAIDHVRKLGNIGAHMEKDISLIVEIDSDEAQVLIELIETLFDEWYVARKVREDRFASLKALRIEKDAQKSSAKS